MNDTESELLEALRDLEQAARSMKKAGPRPNLLPLFDRIETITKNLGRHTDRLLLHYLHNKSYEKARLHLEGREAENARGSCER